MPSTAWTTPSSVGNSTRRSSTRSSGSPLTGGSRTVAGSAALTRIDPRIEIGVGDVDDDVRDDDEHSRRAAPCPGSPRSPSGRSRRRRADRRPGMLKTVSTRMAPPSSTPISSASSVTIGLIAARTPWRTTRRSFSPLRARCGCSPLSSSRSGCRASAARTSPPSCRGQDEPGHDQRGEPLHGSWLIGV